LWAAAVAEAIIYFLTILSIYFLTREWAGTRSAVLGAFLWGIYLPATELIPQVSGDLLAALCTTIGMLFTLRARKTGHTADWLLAGTGLGLAILSRSVTLVIALLVMGGLILESWHQHRGVKTIVQPVMLIPVLAILSMVPWLIRNELSLGRPVIGSSLTGYNLYRHNYMIDKPYYFRYVGPEEGYQAITDLISRQPELRGDENEAQMDLIYRNAALQIIKSHPIQYILLSAYRFFPLWFDWGMAEAYGRPLNRYDILIMSLQAILLTLALLGMYKKVRLTWPLWGSFLAVSMAYMAIDARLLYVMPVMPLVISLSAVGINKLLASDSINQ
jgi:4-amino-4-deoxy-L-arabinose transferase-like glycosyltransferase